MTTPIHSEARTEALRLAELKRARLVVPTGPSLTIRAIASARKSLRFTNEALYDRSRRPLVRVRWHEKLSLTDFGTHQRLTYRNIYPNTRPRFTYSRDPLTNLSRKGNNGVERNPKGRRRYHRRRLEDRRSFHVFC